MTEDDTGALPSEISVTRDRRSPRRLSSAFFSIVVVGLGIQVLNVASGPLVAHMLGPTGRGELATVMVVAILCSQVAFGGFPAAVSHAVAVAKAPALDVLRGLRTLWNLLALIGSAVACGLTIVLLPDGPHVRLLVVAVAVATFVTTWQFVMIAMLLGEGHVRHVNLFRLTTTLLYVGSIVAIFVIRRTDHPAVVLLINSGAMMVGLVVVRAKLDRPTGDLSVRVARSEISTFARRSFVSGIGALDSLGIDQLLVGIILGQASLGLYAVAFSITSLPLLVLHGVGAALLPRMAVRSNVESVRMLRRWVAASIGIDAAIVVALQLVLGPAIRLAFGSAFVPAIATARILVLAWAFLAFRRVLTAAAQAQGRAKAASIAELSCGAILIVAVAIGSHLRDIEGAALGLGFAAVISCVWLGLLVSWTESSLRAARPVG